MQQIIVRVIEQRSNVCCSILLTCALVTTSGMESVVIDRHVIAYCAMALALVFCWSDVHRCDAVSMRI